MFTGIVEEVGRVLFLRRSGGRARLAVEADLVLRETRPGDSISIDGVCQTVVEIREGSFAVDCMAETLGKTTLGALVPGSRVNLERALRADSRLGGHILQGHVSAVVPIRSLGASRDNVYLRVDIPEGLLRHCVPEGSIALDGMSLTIAGISGTEVLVNIIPATLERTSLRFKKAGDRMNLETDIIGRYVERLLGPRRQDGNLTAERLREWGYGN